MRCPDDTCAGGYGYTARDLAWNFPNGWQKTSYGYLGRKAYSKGTPVLMGTRGVFSAPSYFGSRYYWYGWSRRRNSGTQPAGEDQCGYCSSGCLLAGGEENVMPCAECNQVEAECLAQYSPTEDASRDDLMETGFILKSIVGHLIVRIDAIQSSALLPANMCPPYNKSQAREMGWAPPDADIFLTISHVQTFAPAPAPPRTLSTSTSPSMRTSTSTQAAEPLPHDPFFGGDLLMGALLFLGFFCGCLCIGLTLFYLQANYRGAMRREDFGVELPAPRMRLNSEVGIDVTEVSVEEGPQTTFAGGSGSSAASSTRWDGAAGAIPLTAFVAAR